MYYLVLLTGSFLAIFNKKKISFVIFASILALMAFLRYGVGPDYFSYNFLFNRLSSDFLVEINNGLDSQEIGFRLIGVALKKSGVTYRQYLMFFSAINIIYISKTCIKYSKNAVLSLLIYFCFYYFVWTFSGIRQGVTIAIGIYYLLECIEKKNIVKMMIITIILSTIHSSSIMLMILYLMSMIEFKRNQLIVFTFLSLLIGMLPLGNVFLRLNWIPLLNRASYYWSYSSGITNLFDFQSLGRIAFIIIALFYYNIFSEESEISHKIINVYIVSMIMYFLLKFSEGLASRISLYGKVLDIVILSNILYIYKNKINKSIYIFALSLLCFMYFAKELNSMHYISGFENKDSYDLMIPYTNVFNFKDYYFNNKYYFNIFD